MNDLLRASRPGRGGHLGARPRGRGLRAPAPGDHRPRQRRPADDRRRRQLGHAQRRDLQLHRAARAARQGPLHDELRHRGDPARLPPVGRGLPRAAARDVLVRALGRGDADALRRARPLRDQAALLHGRRRRSLLRLRGEGAAALPADRSRPTSTGSPTTSRSSSRSPARRSSRASRSCCRATSCASATARVETQRYWEVYFEPDFDHTRRLLRAAHAGAAGRLDLAPPARRRPDRLLPERRPRLEHRRLARLDDARPRHDGLHRPVRDAGLRREPLRPQRRRRPRLRAPRDRDRARRLRRPDRATSSTTSTTRSPARARSRSTWSRSWRPAPQGRARRPGRRRDLRRLRPLPDRVLRAVHQGRDRRNDALRQLRRHLRVDHPEPARRCANTSRCCASSGARASSRISTRATSV